MALWAFTYDYTCYLCCFLGIVLPADGYADDDEPVTVTSELLERYNQLVRRARAVESDGPGAVIKVYTEALVDPVYQAYGQIHLKLGALLKESGRFQLMRLTASKKCLQDHRVDKLDWSIICQAGYEDTTTTLELLDQPPRSKVVVLEPALFSGPIQSGARLPLGRIRVVVEAPGYFPHETYIVLESPMRWIVEVGMKRRRGLLVPDGFITEDVSSEGRTRSMPRDWKSLLQIQSHVTQRPIGLLVVSVLQSL